MHKSSSSRKGFQEKISIIDRRITFISDIKNTFRPAREHKIETHATMLCTSGEATIMLNNQKHHVEKNDLVVFSPGDHIEGGTISDDFNGCGFNLSLEFFTEMDSLPSGVWSSRVYFAEHPVTKLNDEAARIFKQYYDLICSKFSVEKPLKNHQVVTHLLMQAFMYEFHDTMEEAIEFKPVRFTTGDHLFRKFLDLLISSYPKPRSVTWYADKLYVTPKYLSSVCKARTSNTASTLITRYVIEDIKRNLLRPEKTIKEISNELGFPSISFFGKYVRKHLGVSPKIFRKQLEEGV